MNSNVYNFKQSVQNQIKSTLIAYKIKIEIKRDYGFYMNKVKCVN